MKGIRYGLLSILVTISLSSCSSRIVAVHVPPSTATPAGTADPSGPADPKLPANGIFFALPRTVVTVDVPVELSDSQPGKHADFAPIFFPDKEAVKSKAKKLQLKMAKFNTYGEPDPKALYYVQVTGSAAVDWARTFQFNEDGTVSSVKEQADNQTSDILLGVLSTAAGLAAKGIGDAEITACAAENGERTVECYLGKVGDEYKTNFLAIETKDPELFKRIIDNNTLKQEKDGTYVVRVASPLYNAVQSIQKISSLTKQREDMLTAPPPGVTLSDAIFNRIDSLIAERVKEFIGIKTTSSWTGSFEARPGRITDVVTLFKINPTEGLCVVADVGGKEEPPIKFRYNFAASGNADQPVYCKDGGSGLQDVQLRFSSPQTNADDMLTRIKDKYNVVEDEDAQPQVEERAFRFRIPASVKVSVITRADDSVSSETRLLVAQFGVIVSLPASPGGKSAMYSLQYYASTGALKNFDLTTKAVLTKGTIDTLNSSAGAILDAQKRAAEAKAKKADQLTQLDRKRSILEDEVKILAACKALNIDCSKP